MLHLQVYHSSRFILDLWFSNIWPQESLKYQTVIITFEKCIWFKKWFHWLMVLFHNRNEKKLHLFIINNHKAQDFYLNEWKWTYVAMIQVKIFNLMFVYNKHSVLTMYACLFVWWITIMFLFWCTFTYKTHVSCKKYEVGKFPVPGRERWIIIN